MKQTFLDDFIFNTSNFTHKSDKYKVATKENAVNNYLFMGVLARTHRETQIPYFDDLAHHMLVVATASLKYSNKELTTACLIHDMLKGLLDFRLSADRYFWLHYTSCQQVYENILYNLRNNTNIDKIFEYVVNHHSKHKPNKIWMIENRSNLISAFETLLFWNRRHDEYLKTQNVIVSGKYRTFLLTFLYNKLVENLSRKYSDRFKEVIGVRRIRFLYVPTELQTIDDFVNEVLNNPENWRIEIVNDTLEIKLPARGLPRKYYIEFNECADIQIDVRNGIISGVKIPFGLALSTVYLTTYELATIVYIDAGFQSVDLSKIIKEIRDEFELKEEDFNEKDILASLVGNYVGQGSCIFCGNYGQRIDKNDSAVKSLLEKSFTDGHTWLSVQPYICPMCRFGYSIEEKLRRMKGKWTYLPEKAYIDEVTQLISLIIQLESYFAESVASDIWLKVLSKIYYHLSQIITKLKKNDKSLAEYFLDPKILLLPYEVSIIPLATYIPYKQKKKFILQGGLHSSVVLLGEYKDVSLEEFRVIRKVCKTEFIDPVVLIGRLRKVYGVSFGLPNVNIGKKS